MRGSRCEGVQVQRAGTITYALATREVIVSCGAVDSPRLLLLSGIGPGDELREAGVEVVQDVPGVGRNLHDHPLTCLVYQAKREIPPGSANLSETSLLWRSEESLPGPDMQMQFTHAGHRDGAGEPRHDPAPGRRPRLAANHRPAIPDRGP